MKLANILVFSVLSLASIQALAQIPATDIPDPDPLNAEEHGLALDSNDEWLITGTYLETKATFNQDGIITNGDFMPDDATGRVRLYKNNQFVRYYTINNSAFKIGYHNRIAINDEAFFIATYAELYRDIGVVLIYDKQGNDYAAGTHTGTFVEKSNQIGYGKLLSADEDRLAIAHNSGVEIIRKVNGSWIIEQEILVNFEVGTVDLNEGNLVIGSSSSNEYKIYSIRDSVVWVEEASFPLAGPFSSGSVAISGAYVAIEQGSNDVVVFRRSASGNWSYFQVLEDFQGIADIDADGSRLIIAERANQKIWQYELVNQFVRRGSMLLDPSSSPDGLMNISVALGFNVKMNGENLYVSDRNANYSAGGNEGTVYHAYFWHVYVN